MDCFAEIDTVLNYIEANLAEPLSPETISGQAYRSLPHFYRIFDQVVGDTVMNYVRKRRLSRATQELVATERPIIDIAVDCGYESQQTFNRAFTRAFGMPPGRWRVTGDGHGEPYPRCDLRLRRLALAGVTFDSVRIVELEPLRVASYHALMTDAAPRDRDRIPGKAWTGLVHWQMADRHLRTVGAGAPLPQRHALGEWFVSNGLHLPPRTRYFGFDNPWPQSDSECGYEAWASVPADAQPTGKIVFKDFSGGLYATAPATYGEHSNLRETWQMLHLWLQQSEYTYGDHQWLEEHLTIPGAGRFHGVNLLLAIRRK